MPWFWTDELADAIVDASEELRGRPVAISAPDREAAIASICRMFGLEPASREGVDAA